MNRAPCARSHRPDHTELAHVAVRTAGLDEASATIRDRLPDDRGEIDPRRWADLLSIRTRSGAPRPDAPVPAGTPSPECLRRPAT
ncbi:hypothetical protein PSA01_12470 [Pseudonocardia saturnea]|uniref:Uncharacterized protein n=1 Tax=Pseudonocardia saturnea TaxID=33909 RepID=A0ABQ0RU83_9PSEU|nr:hypothetical protein PSA01_12470 [Pseudonocardia saturnea]